MIDGATIAKAARLLARAAPRRSRVILFGSHARGQAGPRSDLDLLVVEPRVRDAIREAARLDRVLVEIRSPLDLVVLSRQAFERWKDTPNTLPYEASRKGKVLYGGT